MKLGESLHLPVHETLTFLKGLGKLRGGGFILKPGLYFNVRQHQNIFYM